MSRKPPVALDNGEPPRTGSTTTDPAERHRLIAQAAYCRAEARGFAGSPELQLQDWLLAESEIDRALAEASLKP